MSGIFSLALPGAIVLDQIRVDELPKEVFHPLDGTSKPFTSQRRVSSSGYFLDPSCEQPGSQSAKLDTSKKPEVPGIAPEPTDVRCRSHSERSNAAGGLFFQPGMPGAK